MRTQIVTEFSRNFSASCNDSGVILEQISDVYTVNI